MKTSRKAFVRRFTISNYITGVMTSSLDRVVRAFTGNQHMQHCRKLLGDDFRAVHREVDARRGAHHRIYGHSEEFICATFQTKNKRVAARVHVIGDLVLDIFPKVLEHLKPDLMSESLLSPDYTQRSGAAPNWDISNKAMDRLAHDIAIALKRALPKAK